MKSPFVLFIIMALLLGSCSVIAGGVSHWPASLVAVVVIIAMKLWNDRVKILAWPMEFLLAAGVTMIVINLARLYMLPMAY
ncbi:MULTISPECIES: hypothetical protein [unclassified Rhizobium]|uniref:hypothetical protein n=1 Tax=unclassified Rhizobium TaxID=2613769 RepID=UPI00040E5EE4|nr:MULTISPECIES: hypothetical protein [unclassified Rhizobium]MBD9454972.1 hypothetical protein [Rhizobium sp. RHZ02]NMN71537.1 hypothetical protein [Rhizobium sp. 57MFTsu3.2]